MIELEPKQPEVVAVDNGADGGRQDIASALLDVLTLTDDQLTENQRAFTCEMLTALVGFLTDDFLVEMADKVSRRTSPALSLMRALLLKPIDIARPLLERQSNIPDGLLIETMHVSQEHQRAVAGRFRISERVADDLFENGSPALRVAMLMRDEVPVAPHRVELLVEQSRNEPSLRLPLLGRTELQPGHGFKMFWWMDRAQRCRTFSRFNVTREPIQDLLAPQYVRVFTDPKSDPIARGILSLCDRRHRPRNSTGQVLPMPSVEQMLKAVRAKPTPELCGPAGLLAGVSARTGQKVMLDEGGEPFAVLCKSLGVPRGHFGDILSEAEERRTPNSLGPSFDEDQRDHIMMVFDTISRDYARTILRYWDWQDAMVALAEAEKPSSQARRA